MRKFGLIGYPLGHSFSARYFAEKFQRASIRDCVYTNYEIAGIGELREILKDPELCGLNVTIPYKESLTPFLHHVHQVVSETAACNCIRIDQGQLTGFNTDVVGFEKSFEEKLTIRDQRALILGTGGSSKAVAWVLKKKGILFQFVSRTKNPEKNQIGYEDLTEAMIQSHTLIVNTTPLGMAPHIDFSPALPFQWISSAHYLFDLVYNPAETLFLTKGKARGARIKNGADMLAIQAEASWDIWNGD